MRKAFLALMLLPLSVIAADSPLKPEHWKSVDQKDIPLEDLAHSFFFHSSIASPDRLRTIISEDGINRLRPELVAHREEMQKIEKLAARVQESCSRLQAAKSGKEFAAVLKDLEGKERQESREAARRVLSVLDVGDKKALERYLDQEFRRGIRMNNLDYDAVFAGQFPSDVSTSTLRRTCDAAQQSETKLMEAKSKS